MPHEYKVTHTHTHTQGHHEHTKLAWYLAHTSRSRPQPFSAHKNLHFDSFCANQERNCLLGFGFFSLLMTTPSPHLLFKHFSQSTFTQSQLCTQIYPKQSATHISTTGPHHRSHCPTVQAMLLLTGGSPTVLCSPENVHVLHAPSQQREGGAAHRVTFSTKRRPPSFEEQKIESNNNKQQSPPSSVCTTVSKCLLSPLPPTQQDGAGGQATMYSILHTRTLPR